MEINKVYCCDNLELMKQISDESVDLIYSDILYGTGKDFGDYQDLKCDRKVIENFYLERFQEMWRICRKSGAIYLQVDYRIVHWIRCLLDDICGYNNFRNEIVWIYKALKQNSEMTYAREHDNILFYAKPDHRITPDKRDFPTC